MPDGPIYLDHNATTPVDPAVLEAMLPYLHEHFGNPSSGHVYGRRPRHAVETARAQVADLLGAQPGEIVFTSGGTESNNMAILGVARGRRHRGKHVIASKVEHPAVVEPLRALEREGFDVTWMDVDHEGRVDPSKVARKIHLETTLVTIMHANNEVGTIQPIREIARIAHARGALVHTDASQSVGKIPCRLDQIGADLLTIAGHKLYAPKGVGALYVRRGIDLPHLLHGAPQEGHRRPGTENVPGIVGLGRAAALAATRLPGCVESVMDLRDRLWHALFASGLDVHRNGGKEPCLPNTLSVGFGGIDAATLLEAVGDQVAASAGAACHAGDVEISPVLRAMHVPERYAKGTIRLSLGHGTTAEDVDAAAKALVEAAKEQLDLGA